MRGLRILYIAMHETLEYDDLRILTKLGHTVFSTGSYRSADAELFYRPARADFFSPEDNEAYLREPHRNSQPPRLSRNFVQRFDVVIVNHDPHCIVANQEALEGTAVIFRTIGQSLRASERVIAPYLKSVHLVRYSPVENIIPRFNTNGTVIRFGKFPEDFACETRDGPVLTFYNNVFRTDCLPAAQSYRAIVKDFSVDLYGLYNDTMENWKGVAQDQKPLFARCKAYLYVHSAFASYTLNLIEAMMSGCAVLAPSASYIDACMIKTGDPNWDRRRYEVEALLDGCGLIYNSEDEARTILRDISLDRIDIATIGAKARARAIALFDSNTIAGQWSDLLTTCTNKRRFSRPGAFQFLKAKLLKRNLAFWRSRNA